MEDRTALHVRGSPYFLRQLASIPRDSDEYRMIDEALSSLKENVVLGVKVPKQQWPKLYVQKYGINNLYKLDLSRTRRLTYTIVAEEKGRSVIVLEYFPTHKEYDARFGY